MIEGLNRDQSQQKAQLAVLMRGNRALIHQWKAGHHRNKVRACTHFLWQLRVPNGWPAASMHVCLGVGWLWVEASHPHGPAHT